MHSRLSLCPWSLAFAAVVFAACSADPFAQDMPTDCSVVSQNEFVYDVMAEYYLWNDEIPDVDTREYDSPEALLQDLRNTDYDRWSRISDKVTSDALFKRGQRVGLGFRTKRDPDGLVRLATVYGDAPAGLAGLQRGDILHAINGRTIAEIDDGRLWNTIFGEDVPGVAVDLQVEALDGSVRSVSLVKDWHDIPTVPVHTVLDGSGTKVGYLSFETFVETAAKPLDEAFAGFAAEGVEHVIVDMRYNGGGLISIARQLMSLLAGRDHGNKEAYRVEYNEKYKHENSSYELETRASSLSVRSVVFITTSRSVSASELVINALRPYAEVKIVGEKTGGKPVGSRSWEFCEKLLFPITFRLVNAAGEGNYFHGMTPDCAAPDDLLHALGDPDERSLAAAVALATGAACPETASGAPQELGDPLVPDSYLGQILGTW